MDWIDSKYISLASNRLDRFKWVRRDLANFRCPICGDSSTNKRKARGYIHSGKHTATFSCHNCGVGMSLYKLLVILDNNLAMEYKRERFIEEQTPHVEREELEDNIFKVERAGPTIRLPLVKFLPDTHPAKQYIQARQIPLDKCQVYYCKNFPQWAAEWPQLAKWKYVDPHPRIVMEILDKDKHLVGFSARSFGNEKPKYCNVNLTDEPMMFGIDRLQDDKIQFVCEGPIDSLMLDNCVAVLTSNLMRASSAVDMSAIYIPDHQPRNPEIVGLVRRMVNAGLYVTLWPDDWPYKDLNEAKQNGAGDLEGIVVANSFRSLKAMNEFNRWKKI